MAAASANNNSVVPAPQPVPADQDNTNISRSDFPAGFVFGAGTSAYQVEGAYAEGGRSLTIWDEMSLNNPSAVADGSNGNVATDMYHRYKEDIANMKRMGFDYYRFSLSWSRILPGGRRSLGVNREAINYYNNLIDTVIANGLQPLATIFHFDLPNCLQTEYGGFLSRKILSDFREYAEVCFWEFGDRVKFWTTVNEPWTYCINGYVNGVFPPNEVATTPEKVTTTVPAHRVQNPEKAVAPVTKRLSDVKFDKADPAKDAYTVARNLLLAHSEAVQLYRTKYQVFQEGKIGIALNSHMFVPLDETSDGDKAAANRAIDFMLGWFLEPVLYGHYPQSMINNVPAENLAQFSPHEAKLLKGSTDFLGLNYYTTYYVSDTPDADAGVGPDADQKLTYAFSRNGQLIGEQTASFWLYVVPWGIYDLLKHINSTYKDCPTIYITENGYPQRNDPTQTVTQATVDPKRIKFYQDHLANILKAVNEGVDVKGYFIWAYCDNYEWSDGFSVRFGIMFIDYANNLGRYPKDSAIWFAGFLKGKKKAIDVARKRQIDEVNDATDNESGEKRLKAN